MLLCASCDFRACVCDVLWYVSFDFRVCGFFRVCVMCYGVCVMCYGMFLVIFVCV